MFFRTAAIFYVLGIGVSVGISCYECVGGKGDPLCSKYSGASCGYGMFGCVKLATYSGGVDKMGNFINDPRTVTSMIRGCNFLPLGGVDACQQSVVFGYRIVTCYCFSDFCNSSFRSIPLISLVFLGIFFVFR